jgi:hypothetical protein
MGGKQDRGEVERGARLSFAFPKTAREQGILLRHA